MAPNASARNKNGKKPVSNDNKTTTPAFAPNRQLTRTPPPPANAPIAGTPLTIQPDKATTASDKAPAAQPSKESAPSIGAEPSQTADPKMSMQDAINALDAALGHVTEAYQETIKNLEEGEDRSEAIVATPFPVFERIGRKLTQVKEYFAQQKTFPTEIREYFSQLEQSLKETITTTVAQAVKETMATTTKTYASATATNAPMAETPTPNPIRVNVIQQQNLQRRVERRREQNKFEVTLTAQVADSSTKDKLKQQTHAEITANLQQSVNKQVKERPPTLSGIQKLQSQDIRIHVSTESEAEQLRNLKWDDHYKGLIVRQPKFGIMIPGISTATINPYNLQDPELIQCLEQQNKGIGLEILGIKLLQRKLDDNADTFSLIMFLSRPDMANRAIKHGIYYNYERLNTVEKYSPQLQLIQCYNCTQLGHHASKCKSPHPACGKCSGHHLTSECTSEIRKCSLCKGEHQAISKNCPRKIEVRKHLTNCRRESPPYFNE
jgi:hypothetical protein